MNIIKKPVDYEVTFLLETKSAIREELKDQACQITEEYEDFFIVRGYTIPVVSQGKVTCPKINPDECCDLKF